MAAWKALALGAVQGLTEFLPISSSGHLVFIQALFGFNEPMIFFDVMVHLATLGSLAAVFKEDLLWLWHSLVPGARVQVSSSNPDRRPQGRQLILLLLIGTLPAGLVGLLFHKTFARLFASPAAVGAMLIVTGTFLWTTKKMPPGGRPMEAMRWTDAIAIGFAQAGGLVPGISRTGATIVMALFLGLERELAARYSLMLAMPAIAGAAVLSFVKGGVATTGLMAVLLAMVVAFVTGYVALRVILRVVVAGRLAAFAPYCWIVGVLVIIMAVVV
jgi:undecaprenyl-diphosphatase